MSRGRAAERRSTRHRIYSLLGFVAIIVIGAVAISLLHGATRKRVGKVYRDPERALYDIVAPKQTLFRREHGRYGTLDELVKDGHLSSELLEGPVEGFRYKVAVASVGSFVVTAEAEGPEPPPDHPPGTPAPPPQPRQFHFYRIDETWNVRAEASRPAGPDSPVIFSPRDAAFR